MAKKDLLLAELVNMNKPKMVYAEVKNIVAQMNRGFDFTRLDQVFIDTVALYEGNYPGYRKCTTEYHDLRHTTDVLLALARLIHGAHIAGVRFGEEDVAQALISALLHDTGYIQTSDDDSGTGGKYTLTHVERSAGFLTRYFAARGWDVDDCATYRGLIYCTSHGTNEAGTSLPSPEAAMLGKMIATADLVGQLADRLYLEKLLFLYREFCEANLMTGDTELDLLKRTVGFYGTIKQRLAAELDNTQRFMRHHFLVRWDMDRDPYMESVERNLTFLDQLITNHQEDYRQKLKRGGLLTKLMRLESRDKSRIDPFRTP
jgi:hypothetical protein